MESNIGVGTAVDLDLEALFNLESPHKLILWNDDVNSFDVVIVALESFLEVSEEKATKFAATAHTEGRAAIAGGTREEMELLADKFGAVSINVTVESPE